MADISVTASSVVPSATATIARGTAGATITAGQPLYQDANNKLQPAAQTSSTTAHMVGIAVDNASSGQPVEYVSLGDVTFNAVLSPGKMYVLGANAGGISLSADLDAAGANTRYGNFVGVATSSTNLRVGIVNSDVLRS